ncbi:MAG: SAM-dependent methyltransferase [Opitutales bacterium]|nr:SAM-dependent methyltransferase [Opitutales bacterium]
MLAALRKRANGSDLLSFETFMEVALYAPAIGYYRRPKTRVAYADTADFYTNSSLRSVFAPLVKAAAIALLPEGSAPGEYTFVEFGSEPGQPLLADPAPFLACATRDLAADSDTPLPARSVVFSNELFDAQPFRRFRMTPAGWREIGVRIAEDRLCEVALEPQEAGKPLPDALPAQAPEGYTVDWPEAAGNLLQSICDQNWEGLFIAFDYGLDEETLLHERPGGTARAYSRHRQHNDLLASPGKQDLTCHVNWTRLAEALNKRSFQAVSLRRQEAFFMQHAAAAISQIVEKADPGVDRDRQRLKELLHPHYFGSRFQVLHGYRPGRHCPAGQ